MDGRGNLSKIREEMVYEQIVARGIAEEGLIQAFLAIPRHAFVDSNNIHEAYEDGPLPIGYGQTINQPYVIALMLELVIQGNCSSLLEIGSGSGYLLAVASLLFTRVYGIERVEDLAARSQSVLRKLGIGNVTILHEDGSVAGSFSGKKFDAIIISCATDTVPEPLFDLLAPGGTLVAPVGDKYMQELLSYHKNSRGILEPPQSHGIVRFVPLIPSVERSRGREE